MYQYNTPGPEARRLVLSWSGFESQPTSDGEAERRPPVPGWGLQEALLGFGVWVQKYGVLNSYQHTS